jgi:predicted GNAT family acetyltransferase
MAVSLQRTANDMDEISVSDNSKAQRYELRLGAEVAAHADYQAEGDVLVLTHTEVESAYEGKGLGSKLASGTLDDVRKRGLKVRPLCEFMAAYIERHPQYAELVDSGA